MGEVYRARDSRLGRDVALKVLAGHLVSSPDARARFEREARAVASLSHPHICVLHDVGQAEGIDYLVLELVEGETLAARIERGPLRLAEALEFSAQTAEALARAHRAGILHRDLKPGNIMITKTGVKLMDFGLARLLRDAGGAEERLSQSPTEPAALSASNTLVGTLPYTAPELLQGQSADARSDLWALGATMFEMVAGRRAFEAGSTASLAAAILTAEPPPLPNVGTAGFSAFESLIRTCLSKDPDLRWQNAADLARELRRLAAPGGAASDTVVGRANRRALLAPLLIGTLAGLVSLGAGALALRPWATQRGAAPIKTQLTFEWAPWQNEYALSPDGRSVALTRGDSAIFVRRLDEVRPRLIGTSRNVEYPIWSPDSREIAFRSGDNKLVRIKVADGTVQVICDATGYVGGFWTPDGWIVYGRESGGPLMRVRASGGTPEPATMLDEGRHEVGHIFPELLPDGRHFLFAAYPPVQPNLYSIHVGDLVGRSDRVLLLAQSSPRSDGRGRLVFLRDDALLTQQVDLQGRRLIGEPAALAESPALQVPFPATPIALVAGPTMVYYPEDQRATEYRWYTRAGLPGGVVVRLEGPCIAHSLDATGRQLITRRIEGYETCLWLADLGTGAVARLTDPKAWNSWPIWSADGTRILYASGEEGGRENRIMSPDDPSAYGVLISGAQFGDLIVAAPGGKLFVLVRGASNGRGDLMLYNAARPRLERAYAASSADESDLAILPDGHHAVFVSDASGRKELYLDDFPERHHAVRLTSDGCGYAPSSRHSVWAVGNQLIFVATDNQTLRSMALLPAPGGYRPGPTTTLFRLPDESRGTCPSPDGTRFLVATPGPGLPHTSLHLVQNWDASLLK